MPQGKCKADFIHRFLVNGGDEEQQNFPTYFTFRFGSPRAQCQSNHVHSVPMISLEPVQDSAFDDKIVSWSLRLNFENKIIVGLPGQGCHD